MMVFDTGSGYAYLYSRRAVNDGEWWFERCLYVDETGEFIPDGTEVIFNRRDLRRLDGGEDFLLLND